MVDDFKPNSVFCWGKRVEIGIVVGIKPLEVIPVTV